MSVWLGLLVYIILSYITPSHKLDSFYTHDEIFKDIMVDGVDGMKGRNQDQKKTIFFPSDVVK